MEIWKGIKGFEGMYMVSNYGNVKGVERLKKTNKYGQKTTVQARNMKPYDGNGYLRVCLSKDNKKTIVVIHRMVGEYFIPNPHGKPMINHKDGNKHNNHYTNLEWCTNSENMTHFYTLRKKGSK